MRSRSGRAKHTVTGEPLLVLLLAHDSVGVRRIWRVWGRLSQQSPTIESSCPVAPNEYIRRGVENTSGRTAENRTVAQHVATFLQRTGTGTNC